MKIALIDYDSGNLRSAQKAFERVAATLDKTATVTLSRAAEDVMAADYIVLPGVGAFGDCAAGLAAIPGMIEALNERVVRQAYPFLGICVGMQLMLARGHENKALNQDAPYSGLGWIEGDVDVLQPQDKALKIPHMGWNEIEITDSGAASLANGLAKNLAGADVYFVHSYQAMPAQETDVLAVCDYGGRFAAMIGRDNMIGTQFHPEKSQANGLQLIDNFLRWRP